MWGSWDCESPDANGSKRVTSLNAWAMGPGPIWTVVMRWTRQDNMAGGGPTPRRPTTRVKNGPCFSLCFCFCRRFLTNLFSLLLVVEKFYRYNLNYYFVYTVHVLEQYIIRRYNCTCIRCTYIKCGKIPLVEWLRPTTVRVFRFHFGTSRLRVHMSTVNHVYKSGTYQISCILYLYVKKDGCMYIHKIV